MPSEFDAAVNKALDDYELMRRKAAAWDLWREMVGDHPPTVTWSGVPLNNVLDAVEVRAKNLLATL